MKLARPLEATGAIVSYILGVRVLDILSNHRLLGKLGFSKIFIRVCANNVLLISEMQILVILQRCLNKQR